MIKGLLAAVDLSNLPVPQESGPASPAVRDGFTIVAIAFGLAALIALALFLRHRAKHPGLAPASAAAVPAHERSSELFQGKKGRRREKTYRNPTLAETGGLPPIKQRNEKPNA